MRLKTKSDKETRKLGEKLASQFIESEKNRSGALIVSLEGDLGAGKTTFTQGLAKGLSITNWIKSPTFILMREHKIINMPGLETLYHIDCYRLNKPKSLFDIGLKDILDDPKNIVLIEWADKLADYLPKNIIQIKFNHLKEDEREITVS